MLINLIEKARVDSTNDWGKQIASKVAQNQLFVLSADEQTNGRGSRGRPWYCEKNKNITITFVFQRDPSDLPVVFFTQLATVAVFYFLSKLTITPTIKWPNDVLCEGKKIAGILLEHQKIETKEVLILGIGINCNSDQDDLSRISQPAISICTLLQKTTPIKILRALFIDQFISLFEKTRHEGPKEVVNFWHKEVQWMIGREITYQKKPGVIQAIESDGSLKILTQAGSVITSSRELVEV